MEIEYSFKLLDDQTLSIKGEIININSGVHEIPRLPVRAVYELKRRAQIHGGHDVLTAPDVLDAK
ncbi:MAG: hypothetical protein OSB67_05395 [Alphaproteobacteria bacterium]|nr:hypothetical protein [Alphaproteobacteria bacterium]